MKIYKNKRGLSLIEIMIAVAMIAILASITIGIVSSIDNQNNEKKLESTFTLLDGAIGEYYEYWNHFPEQNLPLYGQLRSTPGVNAYLEGISNDLILSNPNDPNGITQICDPWGEPLNYMYIPGNSFPKLISNGPDKVFGTADDIQSE